MKQFLLVFLLLFLRTVKGQLHSQGRYKPQEYDVARENIYNIDPPAIAQESIIQNSSSPFRFAKAIPVSIPFSVKQTIIRDDVITWKIKIQSSGALSLSLIFDRFWLPEHSELYIYNEQTLLGAFKAYPSNKKSGKFSVAPMAGDSVYIEYLAPAHMSRYPIIHVSRVVYGYKSLAFLEQQPYRRPDDQFIIQKRHSGRCNVDILCDNAGMDWSNEARAVAVLLTNENQVYCTGVLLNNVEYNGRQLLLTAHHCASPEPETDIVMFNHQRNSCSGYKSHSTSLDTLHGLRRLAASPISDYALYEIQEAIPAHFNVYLAGWSNVAEPPSPLVGIHHPNGDFKKLSIYNGKLTPDCWQECPLKKHWRVSRWTRGTTEPGSSGSPLFDATHRIVGQLHGGSASCWNKNGYDVYGSFNASWAHGLSHFLDPKQTNTVAIDGVFLNHIKV